MFLAAYRFEGEPAALLAGHARMLELIPCRTCTCMCARRIPRDWTCTAHRAADWRNREPFIARQANRLTEHAMSKPLLSALEAARVADEVEALAFAEMYAAAPAPLRERLGLRVERVAGATLLLAPGLPTPMFNRAIGLGLRQEATRQDIEAIAETFRLAGSTNWWLHWNPHATPSGLPAQLEAMGYVHPRVAAGPRCCAGPRLHRPSLRTCRSRPPPMRRPWTSHGSRRRRTKCRPSWSNG